MLNLGYSCHTVAIFDSTVNICWVQNAPEGNILVWGEYFHYTDNRGSAAVTSLHYLYFGAKGSWNMHVIMQVKHLKYLPTKVHIGHEFTRVTIRHSFKNKTTLITLYLYFLYTCKCWQHATHTLPLYMTVKMWSWGNSLWPHFTVAYEERTTVGILLYINWSWQNCSRRRKDGAQVQEQVVSHKTLGKTIL